MIEEVIIYSSDPSWSLATKLVITNHKIIHHQPNINRLPIKKLLMTKHTTTDHQLHPYCSQANNI